LFVQDAARGVTAVGFKEQDVAADHPAHAGTEGQGQIAQGGDGGVFAQTGQLLQKQRQRDAPGTPAGTGQENGCGHGKPLSD